MTSRVDFASGTVTTCQNAVEDGRVSLHVATYHRFFRPLELLSVSSDFSIIPRNVTTATNDRLQKKDRRETKENKR